MLELVKMSLFHEKGARSDPNLSVTDARTFGNSDTVRVGNAESARGEGGMHGARRAPY